MLDASVHQPPIMPDVFVSLDVAVPQDFREKKNRTYFIWKFGKSPDVVIERTWLRWCDRDGQILPTGAERAAQAEAKAAKLAARLRELGIDPDDLGE